MADLFPELLECDHNQYSWLNNQDMNEARIHYHLSDGKVIPQYYYWVCGTCGKEIERWYIDGIYVSDDMGVVR